MFINKKYFFSSKSTNYGAHFLVKSKNSKHPKLFVFGKNDKNQLCEDVKEDVLPPTDISGHLKFLPEKANIVSISSGEYHTLLLTNENKVYGLGICNNGQLGIFYKDMRNLRYDESRFHKFDLPTIIESLKEHDIGIINAGIIHSMFVTTSGRALGCGQNEVYGTLGTGTNKNEWLPKFVKFEENVKIVKVESGFGYSVFVTSKNELWGTGIVYKNSWEDDCIRVPVKVKGLQPNEKIVKISCGTSSWNVLCENHKVFEYKKVNDINNVSLTHLKCFDNLRIIDIERGGGHIVALSSFGGRAYGYYKNPYSSKYNIKHNLPTHLHSGIVQIQCSLNATYLFDKMGNCYIAGDGEYGACANGKHDNIVGFCKSESIKNCGELCKLMSYSDCLLIVYLKRELMKHYYEKKTNEIIKIKINF